MAYSFRGFAEFKLHGKDPLAANRPSSLHSLLLGILATITTGFVIGDEWTGLAVFSVGESVCAALLIFLLLVLARRTGKLFIFIGLLLAIALALTADNFADRAIEALRRSAFIAAFLVALATLRHVAATSPMIRECGMFLAHQPPGRRYAALTLGGHLFGLPLNYGAIGLLGSLAVTSANEEKNAEIRGHRRRRMLLAIQRGFVSTLPWSPLAFAMAITTQVVPGASWAAAVLPCAVNSLLFALTGWVMDTIFKPRLTVPVPPRSNGHGSWNSLRPLLGLLVILLAVIGGIHAVTDVRIVAIVLVVVPVISAVWIAILAQGRNRFAEIARSAAKYVREDIVLYRDEMALLMMAGFIGTVGAGLLAPLAAEYSSADLTVPGWLFLVVLVWLVPFGGQIGMNPILIVSLIAPILADIDKLGVTPTAAIVALTAGWALGGASSPFTATTLMIGSLGGVSATHVGRVWNGAFTIVCGTILSAWVILFATLIGSH